MQHVKKILILFIFLFLISCQKKGLEQNINKSEININKTALAIVKIKNGNQYQNGIVISKHGHVITTLHGLKIKDEFKIINHKSDIAEAKIIKEFPNLDILLLKFDTNIPVAYAKMNTKSTYSEKIYVLARKKNNEIHHKVGKSVLFCPNLSEDMLGISPIKSMPKLYNNAVLHTSHLIKGFSGSMLVNEKGEMIGMNHAFFATEDMKLNLASTNYAIMNIIHTLKNNVSRSWFQSIYSIEKQRLRWLLKGFENQYLAWGSRKKYSELCEAIESVYSKQGYQETVKWIWREFYLTKLKKKN